LAINPNYSLHCKIVQIHLYEDQNKITVGPYRCLYYNLETSSLLCDKESPFIGCDEKVSKIIPKLHHEYKKTPGNDNHIDIFPVSIHALCDMLYNIRSWCFTITSAQTKDALDFSGTYRIHSGGIQTTYESVMLINLIKTMSKDTNGAVV